MSASFETVPAAARSATAAAAGPARSTGNAAGGGSERTPSASADDDAPSSPRLKVLRRREFGPVTVSLVQSDLTVLRCDALVNAANSLSFTPMDGGVSGALRRACAPADVVRQPKRWWDDLGAERSSIKLPSTQAGVQPAAGGLLERGVQHIVHAVGPTWTDYPIAEKTFGIVQPQIRRTVRRALTAAERAGARSVALPAVSGGIFTHWKEGSDIHEREQRAARRAVLQAVFRWAEKKASDNAAASADDAPPSSAAAAAAAESSTPSAAPMPAASSSLMEIFVCDLPRRSKGAVHLFVEEWDALIAAAAVAKTADNATAVASPEPDVASPVSDDAASDESTTAAAGGHDEAAGMTSSSAITID